MTGGQLLEMTGGQLLEMTGGQLLEMTGGQLSLKQRNRLRAQSCHENKGTDALASEER